MARKFATNLDLTHNEILNVRIQVLASAPTGEEGLVYFDSTLKKLGYYSGSEWVYGTTISAATESTLGTIKLAGDIKGGTGEAPQVTNLHLSGDTAVNHKLTSVTDPTSAQDAATKNYVDNKANGLAWKQPVYAATTAALAAVTAAGTGASHTLTANANGILEVDSVKVETLGQRVLVKNQASAKDNGIYTLTTKGEAGAKFVLTRAADAATEEQLLDATVLVSKGTTNGDKAFNLTTDPPFTVDTDSLTWAEIQSGTSVVGDESFTTRVENQIRLKRNTATPSLPGNGEVGTGALGATGKYSTALTGNSSLTEFTITHNLGTRIVRVQGLQNSGGNPTVPVELDWESTGTNAVVVKFPTAPASGTSYFVGVWG